MALATTIAVGEFLPAAVIIFIMAVVGALESYTLDKSRRSIRELLDFTPPTATIRRDNGEVKVAVDELHIGDVVIIRPGERIPVDGTVVTGAGAVNEAPITGESMPVEKQKGSGVFSGTLNETGWLEVRADKTGNDTTLARIVHLVEEAQETKAPIQGIADRFTLWFLPTVLALAITGYLTSGDIKVAVSVLLVACPCAFAIATPTAVMAGIANMARRSVTIKGGIYFELAGKINTLIVDKTGTLTFGRPKVIEIVAAEGVAEQEVLRFAAIAEKYSEHPLADVTLMNDNLFCVVEFVQISRKVLRRIKLNIFFSIIYNESFELLLKFGKSSFLRKQESSHFKTFWIPAYAGMTKWGCFAKVSQCCKSRPRHARSADPGTGGCFPGGGLHHGSAELDTAAVDTAGTACRQRSR